MSLKVDDSVALQLKLATHHRRKLLTVKKAIK